MTDRFISLARAQRIGAMQRQDACGSFEAMVPTGDAWERQFKAEQEEKKYRQELRKKGIGGNYLAMHEDKFRHLIESRNAENDWLKQRHTIPKGPKTWNELLLGDPLDGRSALDKKEKAK